MGVGDQKPDPLGVPNNAPRNATGPAHASAMADIGGHWLRPVLDNSQEVVKVVAPDGTLRYASPAFENVLGYDPAEAVGRMNVLDCVHPDDLPRVLEASEEAMAEDGVATNVAEYRFRHADGSWRWVESVGTYALEDPTVGGVVVTVRDVTRRKEAEEAAREGERRLAAVVSNAHAFAYRCLNEPGWPNEYTSDYALELTGYTPEDLLVGGKVQLGDLIVEEDRQRVWDEVQEAIAEHRSFELEYALRHKDGRIRHVRDYGHGLYDDDGEVVALEGLVYDVTELVIAEERLRKSEKRFRSLVQNAEIIMVVDVDKVVRYASPALKRVLGYRPEDVLGNDAFQVLHPDDTAQVQDVIVSATEKPSTVFSVELRLRHADGSWRHMESNCTSLLEDPAVGGIVFNSRDVTGRKQAERALRESERRFRSSFENAAVGMALVGTDGRWLRVNRSLCEIVGYAEGELLEKSFQDITHPEDLDKDLEQARRLLGGEIGSYQMEKRYIRKDGSVVWILLNGSLVRDEEGGPLYFIAQVQDVSGRKRAEEQLQRQAFHDALTGLPNRKLFMDRLGQALERTRRRRGRKVAVLFMDLDGFKVVNDSLGHEAGDLLLTVVAQRLGRILRPEDTLARFGGDEFVVLLEEVEGPEEAVLVAQRVTEELGEPFALEGQEIFVSVSVGIGLGDARTKTPEYLLRDADTAMYRAKEGRSGYRIFEPIMYEHAVRRLVLEGELRRALEEPRAQLRVFYQPMASIKTGEIVGAEALVRWEHPERGLLSPSEFVPEAEETGLIVPMGRWVLEEACRQAKEWQRRYPNDPPLTIAVNLSARHLRYPGLVDEVARTLKRTKLAPGSLTLEITESVLVTDDGSTRGTLQRLKGLGARLAIDDFGVGYSSLSYLGYLPVDRLKLDRVLVGGLDTLSKTLAIVRAVIDLGHALGIEVVAEGVETQEEFEELRAMGCDVGQGYYWWAPRPAEAAEKLVASNPNPLPDRRTR
ncbi:MAG: diguanylate cyclase/phosphodiesterase (GGDEF & EAL domains) with PAS/PAC sensor(s) [uncultured Rubrobacteraceae bacterium]|uniref:Diguanylate cyclase/phosphodiesterase (GGDEF & EAL domains) with PAS/PAC sensor(S) n=1 Tax=uncultured Rubrobacteraceae bacterium TaxID=349277 RepID=A0A6J4QKU5_9ACTN|nr:MAG: diguanylate cyclase/phosphodiesterase (GGDEF & EAL domains) with PAS/PAC sensor(s) [uncultured Rubrobacteraceae bacterium]